MLYALLPAPVPHQAKFGLQFDVCISNDHICRL
jgi:hypothetical protein